MPKPSGRTRCPYPRNGSRATCRRMPQRLSPCRASPPRLSPPQTARPLPFPACSSLFPADEAASRCRSRCRSRRRWPLPGHPLRRSTHTACRRRYRPCPLALQRVCRPETGRGTGYRSRPSCCKAGRPRCRRTPSGFSRTPRFPRPAWRTWPVWCRCPQSPQNGPKHRSWRPWPCSRIAWRPAGPCLPPRWPWPLRNWRHSWLPWPYWPPHWLSGRPCWRPARRSWPQQPHPWRASGAASSER